MITVAGMRVPRSAMTRLSLGLHSARRFPTVAERIDRAVDSGSRELQLNPQERGEMLGAIMNFPDERLAPLREALLDSTVTP